MLVLKMDHLLDQKLELMLVLKMDRLLDQKIRSGIDVGFEAGILVG
jgi:hypothetical protein